MVTKSPKAAPRPAPDGTIASREGGLNRFFEISRRGSTTGREVRGGLVTFFTMAYIIALNPIIIGTAADKNGNLINGQPATVVSGTETVANTAAQGQAMLMVAAATALIAGLMTLFMGLYGKFPLAIATGLGLNGIIAFSIVKTMTWPQAMGLVVWEGILITILVLTGVRTAIFRAVPPALRAAISVGIGLFIAFIGLVDAGVVRKVPGLTGPPTEFGIAGSIKGWPLAVFVLGFFLLVVLYVRRVKAAMLISILAASALAVVVQLIAKLPSVYGQSTGWMLNIPAIPTAKSFVSPNLGLLGKVDMTGAFFPNGEFHPAVVLGLLLVVLSLMLSDFFDTMGTVVAVGSEAGLLTKKGNPPRLRQILFVDSIAAVAGGLGSVSSNTSYIESASGVEEGARTGLASVVTGLLFLAAIFLAPITTMIPSEAAAPALVFVGFLMMSQVTEIDWRNVEDSLPAFLTIILMPFSYSITVGIGAGFITYALIKTLRGKARQVHPLLWVTVVLFLIYFAQGLIASLIR